MGKHIEKVREMLCEELDRFGSKGELTAGSLETIDKLAHSIKSIDTIMAMEDAYSNDMGSYDGGSYGGGSYGGSYGRGNSRARGGNSNRRGGRGRGRSSRDSYASRGYSYDDAKEDMIEQLEEIMQSAPDAETKRAIKQAIEMIEE